MDSNTTKALFQFFGGYFHQDCFLDDHDWQSIVRGFIKVSQPEDIATVNQGIVSILSSNFSESVLEDKVLNEFGCYYLPSDDGMGFRQWLTNLSQLIEQETKGECPPSLSAAAEIDPTEGQR